MSSDVMAHSAEPFVHPALFYRGDEEYLTGTVAFITDGIAAGDAVAVSVPGRQLALLRSALGVAAEQVLMLDMTEVGRNPGRIIPGVLRAFADAHPDQRVRIIGEPIWPSRSAVEYPACAQHEALINHAFAGRPVTILCPYDAEGLSDDVLADAMRTHPVIMDKTGTYDSDRYDPDVVVADHNTPLPVPADAVELIINPPDLGWLRREVAAFGLRRGLTEDQTDNLVLVITELATNSVEHAGGPAAVFLGGTGADVVCQVRDTGHITDLLAGRRPVPIDQLRGRGLLMVNQLADLVRVHTTPDGTTVQIHLRTAAR
jgi:anti-sigma regulatory factor (Ser/Thr protein kinase)